MGSLEMPTKPSIPATLSALQEADAPVTIPELKPRFRLSTLLLAVTSSSVCLAVARVWPEAAIALVFVMAIALIRVLYGIQLFLEAGKRLSFAREVGLFLHSIFTVIAIGGFVIFAFSLTLGAGVGLGLLVAHNAGVRQTEWVFGGFVTGWILGLVAAFFTGGFLTRLIWFSGLRPPAGGG